MKDEILKRAMFSMPLSKAARNSGIMAGFEEEDEAPEMEEEGMEDMPSMARTPQNPEILMNTLRGDMRSVDARYMELAQMVGEEAAMETPPEVLAMLQIQLGQQGGIGALPQAAGMVPPPMGGGMPSGAPGGAPAMPMPQGMPPEGGIAPFSQGGAEAPPTPDGMPPLRAAAGAFVTPVARLAQYAGRFEDKIGSAAQALNTYLGRALMAPQPTLQRVVGPDGTRLTVQASETLRRTPAGDIVPGVGSQLAPYTTLGAMQSPTFTAGLREGAQRFIQSNPKIAGALAGFPMGTALLESSLLTGESADDRKLREFREKYNMGAEIPGQAADVMAMVPQRPGAPAQPPAPPLAPRPTAQEPAAAAPAPAMEEGDRLGDFITQALKAQEARDERALPQAFGEAPARPKRLTKGERIKAGYEEMLPLYKELLGEDKETAKANALLLLADAGLKLAGSRKPTLGMAIAEAAGGLPQGFAAIAAQIQEREGKIKGAALSQAINDVSEQDKAAQAERFLILKEDYALMKKLVEQQGKQGFLIKDGGMGLRRAETKDGNFVGSSIDPNDPTVRGAVASRFTLRDTDNPFVENRGEAPTTVETDKDERIKIGKTLRSLDNSLATLDNIKGTFSQLYSPGTWVSDKVNNLLVPVSGGLIRPDVDLAADATRMAAALEGISKAIAAANNDGRVAVQEQEWARAILGALKNPVAFFSDKELAAKTLNALETALRNGRQQTLTQLGYERNDYVMRTPSTGTKNDPFVIPSDPEQQKRMFTFLGSTIGKLQDPRATVYLRTPDGRVSPFSPTQLRGLIGAQ